MDPSAQIPYTSAPPGIDQSSYPPAPQTQWVTGTTPPVSGNLCRLIVNYLPSSLTTDGFRNLFAHYGNITNYKLVTNKRTGASLGYGFIEYSQPSEAQMAIHNLNRRQIENKILKVSYARDPAPEIRNANMYVSGLHQDLTIDGLEQLFRPYGTIITSNILKDASGRSRCVGFVRMSLHSEAVQAVQALNGTMCYGKTLTVKIESQTDRQTRRGDRESGPPAPRGMGREGFMQGPSTPGPMGGSRDGAQTYTLFVHGIPTEDSEEWLRYCFAGYGDITRCSVPTDEGGRKKNFGFVTYKTYDSCVNAINALNGASVGTDGKTLQVSFKTEKGTGGRGAGGFGGRGRGRMGMGRGGAQSDAGGYPGYSQPSSMAPQAPSYPMMGGTPTSTPQAPTEPAPSAAPSAYGASTPDVMQVQQYIQQVQTALQQLSQFPQLTPDQQTYQNQLMNAYQAAQQQLAVLHMQPSTGSVPSSAPADLSAQRAPAPSQ